MRSPLAKTRNSHPPNDPNQISSKEGAWATDLLAMAAPSSILSLKKQKSTIVIGRCSPPKHVKYSRVRRMTRPQQSSPSPRSPRAYQGRGLVLSRILSRRKPRRSTDLALAALTEYLADVWLPHFALILFKSCQILIAVRKFQRKISLTGKMS